MNPVPGPPRLPVDVILDIVSHAVDPDLAPVELHSAKDGTFVAPGINGSCFALNRMTRRRAISVLRKAKLVRLDYKGPYTLAPYQHCDVVSYSGEAPRHVPPGMESYGSLHCAYVEIAILRPKFTPYHDESRPSRRHVQHTVTMAQLAVYVEKLAGYSCVSPPPFIEDTPRAMARMDTDFSVGVTAHWLPFLISGRLVVDGRDEVERSLVETWRPLTPLLSLDQQDSWVSMPYAADVRRASCGHLRSDSSVVGTEFIPWYEKSVRFLQDDYDRICARYDKLVSNVTAVGKPPVSKMQMWSLVKNVNAAALLYQLYSSSGLSIPALDRQLRILNPAVISGVVMLNVTRWRHEPEYDDRPPGETLCFRDHCPCSIVGRYGMLELDRHAIERLPHPVNGGFEPLSWARMQHDVLLSHLLPCNCTRADVAACVNSLSVLQLRLAGAGVSLERGVDPHVDAIADDIMVLRRFVRRWGRHDFVEESPSYDPVHPWAEKSSRRYEIQRRLRRAALPYSMCASSPTTTWEAREEMYLPFTGDVV